MLSSEIQYQVRGAFGGILHHPPSLSPLPRRQQQSKRRILLPLIITAIEKVIPVSFRWTSPSLPCYLLETQALSPLLLSILSSIRYQETSLCLCPTVLAIHIRRVERAHDGDLSSSSQLVQIVPLFSFERLSMPVALSRAKNVNSRLKATSYKTSPLSLTALQSHLRTHKEETTPWLLLPKPLYCVSTDRMDSKGHDKCELTGSPRKWSAHTCTLAVFF